MMVNCIITNDREIFRILSIKEDELFIINCKHRYMPYWVKIDKLKDFRIISEDELVLRTNRKFKKDEELTNIERKESSKNITMSHGESEPQPKKPVTKDKKPGRNDLCPCGSGKKYKKCCGINE